MNPYQTIDKLVRMKHLWEIDAKAHNDKWAEGVAHGISIAIKELREARGAPGAHLRLMD
jgi:hypothetical protein